MKNNVYYSGQANDQCVFISKIEMFLILSVEAFV